MDTSTLPLHLLCLLLLASSAAARPCKTLFYFSATATATATATYYPYLHSRNPHPDYSKNLLQYPSSFSSPRHLTLIFATTANQFPKPHPIISFNSNSLSDDASSSSQFPIKSYFSVSSSIRNRTMDIMSVLCGLLFGICFGSLSAVAMFFVWSACSRRRLIIDYLSSSDSDDEEDFSAAKNMGYMALPAKTSVVVDELKKPLSPPKDVV
ncbi:Uncharacterized protein Adt_04540 [Abeliophyllum distichum]|uniref:Uncharacterized protein n=1 Tax=Abeliophyllum distichum TaxID=126358 RepID=A0ABD1V1K0_9LAMI